MATEISILFMVISANDCDYKLHNVELAEEQDTHKKSCP